MTTYLALTQRLALEAATSGTITTLVGATGLKLDPPMQMMFVLPACWARGNRHEPGGFVVTPVVAM